MIDLDYVKESVECGINIGENLKKIEALLPTVYLQLKGEIVAESYAKAASLCHRLEGDLMTIGAVDSGQKLKQLRAALGLSPAPPVTVILNLADDAIASIDMSLNAVKRHL